MTIKIPGYKDIEVIYESKETSVFKAISENNNESVVFKIATGKSSEKFKQKATYEHEGHILKKLNESVIDGIPYCIGMDEIDGHIMLILRYGGKSLASYMEKKGPLPIEVFLKLAIQISNILGRIHQNNIIHKDIKPSNILIEENNNKMYIVDFNISTLLSRENENVINSKTLEGSLPYMSPEQTGRMNRAIDYRSDFYSLGISFYQMLTGTLPFHSENFLDFVHAHIAKKLPAISESRKDVPEMISLIIEKLTAKNAEDRYQTSFGLNRDLELCLSMWQNDGKISNFPLGEIDRSNRFELPQKLYGRQTQIDLLLETFKKVCKGQVHFLSVSGPSGIGKTSLIHEVHRPIVASFGLFMSGKFEQFKRDVPFSALKQALEELSKQLLMMKEEDLVHLKSQLEKNLGVYGRVITEFVPKLEVVFGKLPELDRLTPAEAMNRFNLNVLKFFQVIATRKHPVVMFIDDLQWADSASMNLFKTLLFSDEIKHLLFIGAYRDNEVDSQHPIIHIINDFKEKKLPLEIIDVAPLEKDHLLELIGDMFSKNKDSDDLNKLAEITLKKTKGNPFFVGEFLKSLYREKIINFNLKTGEWNWEIDKILDLKVSDNVVTLMVDRLKRFDKTTQQLLMLASCIGCNFSLNILSIISKMSYRDVASKLWPALENGLIIPLGSDFNLIQGQLDQEFFQNAKDEDFAELDINYRFVHDRIQQGANQLIDVNEKQKIHLEMARLYMEKLSPEQKLEKFFDIANHYNQAISIIESQEEKDTIRELNYQAAVKGIASMAFGPALNYIRIADELAEKRANSEQRKNFWEIDHQKAFKHASIRIECEYLNCNFDVARDLALKDLDYCNNPNERIELEIHLITLHATQSKNKEACIYALQAFELLGIRERLNAGRIRFVIVLLWMIFKLRNYNPEDHLNDSEMTDKRMIKSLDVLSALGPAGYIYNIELVMIIAMRILVYTAPLGVSVYTSFLSAALGAFEITFIHRFQRGKRCLDASLKFLERFPNDKVKGRVYMIHNHLTVHAYLDHETAIEIAHQGMIAGLNAGDSVYAATNESARAFNYFFAGISIDRVEKLAQQAFEVSTKLHVYEMMWGIHNLKQTARCIAGKTNDGKKNKEGRYTLDDETFKESELDYILRNHRTMRVICSCEQAVRSLIFGEYQIVLDALSKYWDWPVALAGSMAVPFNFVNMALCMGQLAPKKSFIRKLFWKATLLFGLWKLKVHTKHGSGPENLTTFYHLARAGYYLVCGKTKKAEKEFKETIADSEKFNYNLYVGLASEMLATIALSRGDLQDAENHFDKCVNGYTKFGAKAKLNHLQETYGRLVNVNFNFHENKDNNNDHAKNGSHGSHGKIEKPSLESITISSTISDQTLSGGHSMVDQQTIIQLSQVISGEIVLEKLLDKIIKILQKNAGATRIIFLQHLNDESQALHIRAEVDQEGPIHVLHDRLFIEATDLSHTVVNYVAKTKEMVIENNISEQGQFLSDPYIEKSKPKSLLCIPIIHQTKLCGILYFENNLVSGAFTSDRVELLLMLSSQMAVSIENSLLCRTLEQKVEERTEELRKKTADVNSMFENLKQGVFLIQEGNIIHHEYSIFMEEVFETKQIGGMNAIDLLFKDSSVGPDQISQMSSVLSSCIGETTLNYSLNVHLLINEFSKTLSNGQTKIIELDWNPIVFNDNIEKIMVTLRDVTENRKLKQEAENQRTELKIISSLLSVPAEELDVYFKSTLQYIEESRAIIQNKQTSNDNKNDQNALNILFRNMHTIKGNSRQMNFNLVKDQAHQTEQYYSYLKENKESKDVLWDHRKMLLELEEVYQSIEKYHKTYQDKLQSLGGKNKVATKVMDNDLFELLKSDPKYSYMLNSKTIKDILSVTLNGLSALSQTVGKKIPTINIEDNKIRFKEEVTSLFNDCFMHLFSNSLEHGIESAEERVKNGKNPSGNIYLKVDKEDTNVVLKFWDDGRGLNLEKIKQKLVKNNLKSTEDLKYLSKIQIAEAIFLPGFSTKDSTSDISGRGIGMNSVQSLLEKSGGNISISVDDNNRATFIIKLPANLAISIGANNKLVKVA
ncbi:MAG: AAA family ATPase [Oligoflexia bacterium]|nr:AAA family ATPase [Oligoflexia bacterium]